ncbi:hypothetical protein MUP29_12400 [bacterium]|nr:hypothetical protein [bacterium]
MNTYEFKEDPVITDVEEPTDWEELNYADSKHLLPEGDPPEEKRGFRAHLCRTPFP